MDKTGDLFGTTEFGGPQGIVFELIKNNGTYEAPVTIAYTFGNREFSGPAGTLLIDDVGNLFGTTELKMYRRCSRFR